MIDASSLKIVMVLSGELGGASSSFSTLTRIDDSLRIFFKGINLAAINLFMTCVEKTILIIFSFVFGSIDCLFLNMIDEVVSRNEKDKEKKREKEKREKEKKRRKRKRKKRKKKKRKKEKKKKSKVKKEKKKRKRKKRKKTSKTA